METRDQLKNEAIELRETGKFEEALQKFKQVIQMDDESSNFRGKMDVLGQLRITYTRMSGGESDNQKRKDLKKLAMQTVDEIFRVATQHPEIPEGAKTIAQVHLANSLVDYAMELDPSERTTLLENALRNASEAVEKLPGSKAHKAWAANVKAQALYGLGRVDEALDTINQGEKWIFEGYEEELTKDDQAELKLNVWLSGLHLTMAKICQLEKKPLLARHYASAVLAIVDPTGTLSERKKDAQRILDSIM